MRLFKCNLGKGVFFVMILENMMLRSAAILLLTGSFLLFSNAANAQETCTSAQELERLSKLVTTETQANDFRKDAEKQRDCWVRRATRGEKNLRGALLIDAVLPNSVDLTGADLTDAVLIRAKLSGARMSGANLTGAQLGMAKMELADLTNAKLDGVNTIIVEGFDDKGKQHLTGANFFHAKLSGATFSRARLGYSFFIQADLSGADLSYLDLTGVNFDKTNLRGAKLVSANLKDVNLRGAVMTGADLTSASLVNAKMLYVEDIKNAKFNNADLRGAAIPEWKFLHDDSVTITGAIVRQSSMHPKDLSLWRDRGGTFLD